MQVDQINEAFSVKYASCGMCALLTSTFIEIVFASVIKILVVRLTTQQLCPISVLTFDQVMEMGKNKRLIYLGIL